jgi:hypothetical protein
MPGKVNPMVLDNGLLWLQQRAMTIAILGQEPKTWNDVANYALGKRTFGEGLCLSGPTDRLPNGRKLTTVAVTDGTVIGSGTATRWAITDDVLYQLLFDNDLATAMPVRAGEIFTLPAFNIGFAGS